jgi:hypothetical protein
MSQAVREVALLTLAPRKFEPKNAKLYHSCRPRKPDSVSHLQYEEQLDGVIQNEKGVLLCLVRRNGSKDN